MAAGRERRLEPDEAPGGFAPSAGSRGAPVSSEHGGARRSQPEEERDGVGRRAWRLTVVIITGERLLWWWWEDPLLSLPEGRGQETGSEDLCSNEC